MDYETRIGTCGFSGSKNSYFQKFRAIEIQDTFYSLPRLSTVARWRTEAPEGFVFTIKAWQGITHVGTSPTWRKSRMSRGLNLERYGNFKPTREVFSAWDAVRAISRELKARFVVCQSPSSFEPSFQNEANLENFFESIHRDGLVIGWEPRGKWLSDPKRLERLLSRLNLVHVVDPFWDKPSSDYPLSYFRLHGLGRRYNYRYEYKRRDLLSLRDLVNEALDSGDVYVMFNVVTMRKAAEEFQDLATKE